MKHQIISKSKAFNKLMKPFISHEMRKIQQFMLFIAILTVFSGCGSPGTTKIGDDTFFQLQTDVAAVVNSAVADAAPLEIKGIQQKLGMAKKAKADRDKRSEAQITEQIYADIKIAKLRTELNQKNNQLLNKRDQVSAAEVYLMDLQEQLK